MSDRGRGLGPAQRRRAVGADDRTLPGRFRGPQPGQPDARYSVQLLGADALAPRGAGPAPKIPPGAATQGGCTSNPRCCGPPSPPCEPTCGSNGEASSVSGSYRLLTTTSAQCGNAETRATRPAACSP